VLDEANEALKGGNAVQRNARVKPQYNQLMAGLPLPYKTFTLTFALGAELPEDTAENRRTIDYIRDEMAVRPGAEVQVTGHTDATGGPNFDNDALSLKRAENFRQDLIAKGFPADQVSAVGRGKRELLDPNNDSKNRRIEVIVR
jgi:outer membrane protein OmpA-like peptidoglycan-associated protein